MNSILVAAIVFACAFGGAILGIVLQRLLPPSHLEQESKDVIKLGTGLVATMAALILGLLVGAAKSSFDAQTAGFQQLSTNIILLDRMLSHYGSEANPSRQELRSALTSIIERLWPADNIRSSNLRDPTISSRSGAVYDSIRNLAPRDEFQRSLQAQALQLSGELARTRWQLSQLSDESLPTPFLVVLSFWLFFLFTIFGLFAPRNATVIAVLFVSALSVAAAIFLIVDLDQPFEGLLKVSGSSLEEARAQIGQ